MGIEYPAPQQARYGDISREKYGALIAKLKADSDASNLVESQTAGSVTYQKIGFEWVYDPAKAELTVTIVADNNWKAKIAGNRAIFENLNDLIQS